MNAHIPNQVFETVTIKRKTADTRKTFTTVASNIQMAIQPDNPSAGMQFQTMTLGSNSTYWGMPESAVSGVRQGIRFLLVDPGARYGFVGPHQNAPALPCSHETSGSSGSKKTWFWSLSTKLHGRIRPAY